MKRIIPIGAFVMMASVFFGAESYAQDIKPVMGKKRVSDLVARVYGAPKNKFVLKQMVRIGPDGSFRVVFVHNGKRYTFDRYRSGGFLDDIQVWIRPDGTSHPSRPADVVFDSNADGVVDQGSDGRDKIFAAANHYREGSAAEGLKYRSYWQGVYNEALVGLEATLGD